MSNPVRWFEIYVSDMQRAKAFYEKTLGRKLDKLDTPGPGVGEMWTFPMEQGAAGAAGALVKMEGFSGGGGGTIVYFESDDCGAEAGRVAASGGKVMKDKFAIGEHGFIALATDTEGNVFGMHSMK